MAVNWELGVAPDIIGNALNAMEQGRTLKREETARNALGALVQNPNDTAAFGSLAQNSPQIAMQFRKQQTDQADEQRKRQSDQVQMMGRLLGHARDEGTYQQSLAAARQAGLDVSKAPPSFDPGWVQQQRLVLQAYEKDGGQQISGLARELQDAGYQPGTPQFQQAMTTALQGKYAPTYTDQQGNMRQAQLPALPQAGQAPQPQQEAFTADMYQGAVNGLGPERAAEWLQSKGVAVSVRSPQEAMQLPRGTRIVLPDGSEGRVP